MKVALVALLTLTAGCTASPPRPADGDTAAADLPLARVESTEMTARVETGGVVRARATAIISSRVVAPVTAIHVRAGDRVARGARLVTLDARDLQANQARAAAASLSAAEVARGADAEVRAADAALTLARTTHQRMTALHQKRSATTQELDQATAALLSAEAHAASARASLAASDASREAAKAMLDSAGIGTTYAGLSAPFDGIVTERHADPGSLAMPGAALLTVEDASLFRLETSVDEARAAMVRPGDRVEVSLGASGQWQEARVAEVARVDPQSHTFLIKIDLPRGDSLRSGLFGRARLAGPSRQALTIPPTAAIRRGQLTFVFAVDEGRARLRPISAGAVEGARLEVLAGVREGEMIVVHPPPALTDGTPIARGPR